LPVAEPLPEPLRRYAGTIALDTPADAPRRVVNGTGLELRDAVLVDVGVAIDGSNRLTPLGAIGPGATVDLPEPSASVDELPAPEPPAEDDPFGWAALESFLQPLRSYDWQSPADSGEIRLVAWAAEPIAGQRIEPNVDRHRGVSLVVAHLRYGPPPSPDGFIYDRSDRVASRDPIRPGPLEAPVASRRRPIATPPDGVDFAEERMPETTFELH